MPNISQLEYEHYLRRQSARLVDIAKECDQPTLREAEIHQEILDYCRSKGWLAFHGSTAHRTKRTAGECDFCVAMDGGEVLFCEVKRDRHAKISQEQLAIGAWLKKLGQNYALVYSLDDFINAVNGVNK